MRRPLAASNRRTAFGSKRAKAGPCRRGASSCPLQRRSARWPSWARRSRSVFSLSGVTATTSTGKRVRRWRVVDRDGFRPQAEHAGSTRRPSRSPSEIDSTRPPNSICQTLGAKQRLDGTRLIVGSPNRRATSDRRRLAIDLARASRPARSRRRSAPRCGRRAPSPPCSPA